MRPGSVIAVKVGHATPQSLTDGQLRALVHSTPVLVVKLFDWGVRVRNSCPSGCWLGKGAGTSLACSPSLSILSPSALSSSSEKWLFPWWKLSVHGHQQGWRRRNASQCCLLRSLISWMYRSSVLHQSGSRPFTWCDVSKQIKL